MESFNKMHICIIKREWPCFFGRGLPLRASGYLRGMNKKERKQSCKIFVTFPEIKGKTEENTYSLLDTDLFEDQYFIQ